MEEGSTSPATTFKGRLLRNERGCQYHTTAAHQTTCSRKALGKIIFNAALFFERGKVSVQDSRLPVFTSSYGFTVSYMNNYIPLNTPSSTDFSGITPPMIYLSLEMVVPTSSCHQYGTKILWSRPVIFRTIRR